MTCSTQASRTRLGGEEVRMLEGQRSRDRPANGLPAQLPPPDVWPRQDTSPGVTTEASNECLVRSEE